MIESAMDTGDTINKVPFKFGTSRSFNNKPKRPTVYRPPQPYLDIFWTLTEGTDEARNAASLKLSEMILKAEENEKAQVLDYCRDRLIRGLSSGRKFARIGFSVALTQLLRKHDTLSTTDIIKTIKEKLKLAGLDKKSKAEVGGIYLGKAFAFASLIQSGRLPQMSSEDFKDVVEGLLFVSERKSYLKAVCNNTMEILVTQITLDTFGESVWPKMRESMKEGWEECTLDKLSLLLVCREKFPDVVTKKFLRNHWGFPVLSKDNDEKLLPVILRTMTQKEELLLKKLLPNMFQNGRDTVSVWQGLGDRLIKPLPGKRPEPKRQLLGLKLARALLNCTTDKDQIMDLMICPSLAQSVFHVIHQKNDPIEQEANALFEELQCKLKEKKLSVGSLLIKLWKLSADLMEDSKETHIITSNNFTRLVDLMEKEEAIEFSQTLIDAVKGTSNSIELSTYEAGKRKQVETCLRCLQHMVNSQDITSPQLQKDVLTLYLRLGFFHVKKKSTKLAHCEIVMNLEEGKSEVELCKTFFYTCLDHLSTMKGRTQKREDHLADYVSLLVHLTQYMQKLMTSDKVVSIQVLENEMLDQWNALCKIVTGIQKNGEKESQAKDSGFLLLMLYLGFHMLSDFKTASDLLQEVYVCYEKASVKEDDDSSEEGLPWQEVITEVLLNLMSLQSHLGRVISCTVVRLLSSHLTVGAVNLITEVLIPKSGKNDDAGGVLVEADDDVNTDNEEEDENELIDEDTPDEESDDSEDEVDEKGEEEDEEDDDEEEDMQIDEKFRASVKEALGKAAVEDDDSGDGGVNESDDEDLSDLSDTEMFKLDDMLSEVFRQKKKAASGKKNREEKKKEMANFRIRVLDLVEVLIKSERCGDFFPEMLRPILLLLLKTNVSENVSMVQRSKALFSLLKSKAKGLTDSVHTAQEKKDLLKELLDLAQTVTEASHVQEIALSCHMVISLNCGQEKDPDKECLSLVTDTVKNYITKGKSKPHLSFFSSLIEIDVARYQILFPILLSCLRDSSVKSHGKMICLHLLASLMKKTYKENDLLGDWLQQVSSFVSEFIKDLSTDDLRVMFTKEIFNLALTLLGRDDVLIQTPFGLEEVHKLSSIKSKLNTDLRRLANKVIQSVKRSQAKGSDVQFKKKNKNKKKSREEVQRGQSIKENGHTVSFEESGMIREETCGVPDEVCTTTEENGDEPECITKVISENSKTLKKKERAQIENGGVEKKKKKGKRKISLTPDGENGELEKLPAKKKAKH